LLPALCKRCKSFQPALMQQVTCQIYAYPTHPKLQLHVQYQPGSDIFTRSFTVTPTTITTRRRLPPQHREPPPRATARGVGTVPLQNGETTATPPPGQTKRQRNDGTARDDGTTRRRQSKRKKGPGDVKRRLLGRWQVFFYACFIFFVANNLF
jgi:hypothetical protein